MIVSWSVFGTCTIPLVRHAYRYDQKTPDTTGSAADA